MAWIGMCTQDRAAFDPRGLVHLEGPGPAPHGLHADAILPVGSLVGLILLVELLMGLGAWVIVPEVLSHGAEPTPALSEMGNIQALGSVLYTKYIYFFQVAGLVLLVAMIGAIVLTLRHKPDVKRQDIPTQVGRTREASIEVRKVETGKGI